jgi:hypothetical protein
MISKRTKEALQAAKARGVKLGSPGNLGPEAAEKGRRAGLDKIIRRADTFAQEHFSDIQSYRAEGMSLGAIADKMNREGVLTARGKTGAWTAMTVKNVIDRIEKKSPDSFDNGIGKGVPK